MHAALEGDIEAVKKNLQLARQQTVLGFTALMFAARNGHLECARILVLHEARIRDFNGRSALIWAAMSGNDSIVELLIPYELHLVTNAGWTALMNAVLNDHEACARKLLEEQGVQSTDVSSGYNQGTTALIIAATRNYLPLVSLLRPLEQNYTDIDGKDALWHATNNAIDIRGKHVNGGHPRVIQLLSSAPGQEQAQTPAIASQSQDKASLPSIPVTSNSLNPTQTPPPSTPPTQRVSPEMPTLTTAFDPDLKGQLDGLQITLNHMTTQLRRTQETVRVEMTEFRTRNRAAIEDARKVVTELERANQRIHDLVAQVAFLQQQVHAKDVQLQEAHLREGTHVAELKRALHSNLRFKTKIANLRKSQSVLRVELAKYRAQPPRRKHTGLVGPIEDRRSLAQELQEAHLQLIALLEERKKRS